MNPGDDKGTTTPAGSRLDLVAAEVAGRDLVPPVDPAPFLLSAVVDPLPAVPGGSPPPGQLALDEPLIIPPHLDSQLNNRERRTVYYLVAGLSYREALDAVGVAPRAALRDVGPPEHITQSVSACLRQVALKSGTSRIWIVQQTVALYRRAVQAEPVLVKGEPTGEYKLDGATASKCLALLAEWCPALQPRRPGSYTAQDVAALLAEVQARGRQSLEQARARAPQLADRGSAATQETAA